MRMYYIFFKETLWPCSSYRRPGRARGKRQIILAAACMVSVADGPEAVAMAFFVNGRPCIIVFLISPALLPPSTQRAPYSATDVSGLHWCMRPDPGSRPTYGIFS
jgi:hypothetical protein